jgi:hypothetical protein
MDRSAQRKQGTGKQLHFFVLCTENRALCAPSILGLCMIQARCANARALELAFYVGQGFSLTDSVASVRLKPYLRLDC